MLSLPRSAHLPQAFLVLFLFVAPAVVAQDPAFDAAWMQAGQPYVRIGIAEDGIYRVGRSELQQVGVPVGTIPARSFRLIENGREIPMWYTGPAQGPSGPDDVFLFVGRRNRGDETWAYDNDASLQSSTFRSLFTDTTYYWMTWGAEDGLRYVASEEPPAPAGRLVETLRDTLHVEQDVRNYAGDSDDSGSPLYTRGEGYYWYILAPSVSNPASGVFNIPLRDLAAEGDSLLLSVRLNGQTASRHRVGLEARLTRGGSTGLRQLDEVDWTGYAFQTLAAWIDPKEIPDANLQVRVTSYNEFNGNPNYVLMDWIEVLYRRRLEAGTGTQRFTVQEGGASTFVLRGYEAGRVHAFNVSDGRYLPRTGTGAELPLTDAPSDGATYWIAHEKAVRTPAALSLVPGHPWADRSHRADYVILTTQALRASAEEMAAYRRQHDGYRVEVVEVATVFDQFDYGRPTPIAIRRFVQQMRRWQQAPRYLLIWGDAATPVLPGRDVKGLAEWEVPSFGDGASDTWFVVDGAGDWTPSVSLGRIPVRTDADGALFVEKVRSYEGAPLRDWQKHMILIAGGREVGEQRLLQTYNQQWGGRSAAAPTGMDARYFEKRGTDALDPTLSDSLRIAIEAGAGWLNYFGHSAAYTWEVVTEHPHNYNNASRLPVVVSLGCLTGAFTSGRFVHQNTPVFGEQLVVGSLDGAIAHFGSSHLGTISHSALLNDALVDAVFRDTVRVLGDAILAAKATLARPSPGAAVVRHILQYDLLGDPATRIALPSRPDFHLEASDLRIMPAAPTAADSQMTVTVRLHNRGLVPADSVTVSVDHVYPGGVPQALSLRVPAFANDAVLVLDRPIDDRSVGENRIRVQVDPDQVYDEEDESNNAVERSHFVFASGLSLITPRDHEVVTESTPRLRVGIEAQRRGLTTVVFELDSTRAFDSPFRQSYRTDTYQVFADWPLTRPLQEGRTYYWRARIEDPDLPEVNWVSGAFTVRTDLEAGVWLQQGTFEENVTDPFLGYEAGQWRFQTYEVDVRAAADNGSGTLSGLISLNGQIATIRNFGIGIVVLDGQTGSVRAVEDLPTYRLPPHIQVQVDIDSTRAMARLDSLLGTIRNGDYVIVRSRFTNNVSGPVIQEPVREALRWLGSTAIDTLTYNHIWVMTTRYGYPETTQEEVLAPGRGSEIVHNRSFSFVHTKGWVLSPPIGPVRKWRSFAWEVELPDPSGAAAFDVLSADGDSVLIGGLTGSSPVDLSQIDARRHPVLRLRAHLEDAMRRGTPQLRHWQVSYDPIPEVAIESAGEVMTADTLQEGEVLAVRVPVHNLGRVPSESVVVTSTITDASNQTRTVASDTLGTIPPDSVRWSRFSLPTEGYVGTNLLVVRAHQADVPASGSYRIVLMDSFTVRRDQQAPQLSLTIDGIVFPSDPDPVVNLQDPALPFVSGRPSIEVRLQDENPYLPLADTSLIRMELDGKAVSFAHPDLVFEPATEAGRPALVHFRPDLSARDTTHTLRVYVRDASGNALPDGPYQVHFRVQAVVEVESVYPYPNPMSAHTTFAFRLRGADSSVIDDFRIRVYSLSGRLVRELDLIAEPFLLEGGGLRIGWNKVPWDGRDEDGDLLATGVYLYRVYLSAEGEARSVNGRNNVEKLVIIR